jgi:beta-xylosidase
MPIKKIPLLIALLIINLQIFAQRLVMPGDHPDPSVVKIGDTYWASATTSNWFPAYPLMHSKDLVHWQQSGYVFDTVPSWADYYFWAPEISYDNGKVYVYYAAHKKGGSLCVAVAEADKPEGPYKDLGPLICQPDGSIDAFPMRDENGKLYIVWKEDANSVGEPTPVFAQELGEDRRQLIGEKKELFRNTATWEGNLVEGVAMIKHEGYFYAIYAANGCCGASCTYGVGVARAKNLLGPWEKYEANPVLKSGNVWKCPGHGTVVEKDGRLYFLHHAYNAATTVFAGRQGVLTEFKFTSDGWIEFVKDESSTTGEKQTIVDDFSSNNLSDNWQRSIFKTVRHKQGSGNLSLYALPDVSGAYLGQSVLTPNYSVTVSINAKQSTANAGVALIADDRNILYASIKENKIRIVSVKDSVETVLAEKKAPGSTTVSLRMQVRDNTHINFLCGTNMNKFQKINSSTINLLFNPPWDRALRVGLISKGSENDKAVFKKFIFQSY